MRSNAWMQYIVCSCMWIYFWAHYTYCYALFYPHSFELLLLIRDISNRFTYWTKNHLAKRGENKYYEKGWSKVSKRTSPIAPLLHSGYLEHNLECFSGDTWLWGKIIPPLFCPDFEFDHIFSGDDGGSKDILSIMGGLLLLNEPIFFE